MSELRRNKRNVLWRFLEAWKVFLHFCSGQRWNACKIYYCTCFDFHIFAIAMYLIPVFKLRRRLNGFENIKNCKAATWRYTLWTRKDKIRPNWKCCS